jgi:hypothetical protein
MNPILQDTLSRSFSEEQLRQFRESDQYAYIDQQNRGGISIWERFVQWLSQQLSPLLGGDSSGSIIEYIIIGIAALFLVYIVLRLFNIDAIGLFTGGSKRGQSVIFTEEEDIHGVNYAEAIDSALQGGNYRRAVRLSYLQALKLLNDQQHIEWRRDKTNQDYLREITNQEVKEHFNSLSYYFAYAWYGNFPVTRQLYETIDQRSSNLQQILKP